MSCFVDVPSVNVLNNLQSTLLAVFEGKVLVDPGHQMVFESALDDLVQKVGR
jgi:hypothetical protein